MKLVQLRTSNRLDACLGNMYIDGELFCFTVEDLVRDKKEKGITAIPAGKYKIKYRDQPSPMRERYRRKYDWFKNHLHIQDVPGYKYIYLHIGNFPKDSQGCILINGKLNSLANCGENSTESFRKFYLKIASALGKEEEVTLEIRDLFKAI